MKGKRKRGRQKKRWDDNIKDCTGMDFASSTRTAENRTKWKRNCCEFICGAPMTFQGYGIEYNNIIFLHYCIYMFLGRTVINVVRICGPTHLYGYEDNKICLN